MDKLSERAAREVRIGERAVERDLGRCDEKRANPGREEIDRR